MILIVEDDEYKSSKIIELIDELSSNIDREIVDNVRDGVSFLKQRIPSKIILDMSLPSHKALQGKGTPLPLPTGGIEILFELHKRKLFDLPVLILTQYPEIEIENEPIPTEKAADAIKKEYGFKNIEACYYDNSLDENSWIKVAREFLRKI